MNFSLNDEQAALRDSARKFLTANSTSEIVREAIESEEGYSSTVWQRLISEMGWTGIAAPESHGGLGLSFVEIAIVQYEMGRCLYSSPFFSTSCLAIPCILSSATTPQCNALIPPLISGDQTATLVIANDAGEMKIDTISAVLSSRSDGSHKLTGSASFVVCGNTADLLVIAARTVDITMPDDISLIALPRLTKGIHVKKLNTLDLTRPYAHITFDEVDVPKSAILDSGASAEHALMKSLALGNIALAAELSGGAEQCLAFTLEYAKHRTQFGRAIGSFQAIKHKLADMLVLSEAAKSATYYAACTVGENPDQIFEAAALAKSYCANAYFQCASQAIQIHGGIGYTWEHDAHLHFKRARSSMNLLGDNHSHRELLAEMLFDGRISLLGNDRE